MRRRRPLREERYYVGRRPESTEVYVVSGTDLDLLAHLKHRDTASFDWGAAGPGALELAFALLAHVARRRPTELVCTAFCDDVVARLDRAGFVLTDSDIAIWLMTAFSDLATSDQTQSARGRRSPGWIRLRLARARGAPERPQRRTQ
jgi:hypothetical protein